MNRLKEAFHTLSMRDLNHAVPEEIVPTDGSSQGPELYVFHPLVMPADFNTSSTLCCFKITSLPFNSAVVGSLLL